MRNDLTLVFSLLVETDDRPTRRTIADALIKVLDASTPTAPHRTVKHWTQTPAGKRKLAERSAKLRAAKTHKTKT